MKKITGDTGNVGDVEVLETKPLSFGVQFEKFTTSWVYGKWFYPSVAMMLALLVIDVLYELFHIDTFALLTNLFLP